jgi:hypothetical protein
MSSEQFRIPETGYYQVTSSFRPAQLGQLRQELMHMNWVEVVKGRSWDDPEAELIALTIYDDNGWSPDA